MIRLDSENSKGFMFRKAVYSNDMSQRTLYSYIGIRLYFSNVGKGSKVSAYNVILQLYTAMYITNIKYFNLNEEFSALIYGAKLATDFLMMNCYKEKKHYTIMKQIETKDMND